MTPSFTSPTSMTFIPPGRKVAGTMGGVYGVGSVSGQVLGLSGSLDQFSYPVSFGVSATADISTSMKRIPLSKVVLQATPQVGDCTSGWF